MERQRIGLLVAAAIAVAVIAWISAGRGVVPGVVVSTAPATRATAQPVLQTQHSDDSTAPGESEPAVAAASFSDYARSYHDADDLLGFLRQLAPAGDAGNPDALYFMAVASRRCTRDYEAFFGREGRERSLENVLALNAFSRVGEQAIRDLWRQCANFRTLAEGPWRSWRGMLDKAVAAGSPGAIAMYASVLTSEYLQAQGEGAKEELRGRIESMARDALKSKRPEALFWLSGAIPMTMKATDEDENGGSWQRDDMESMLIIAACQRGFDCSAGSEAFTWMCQYDPACQPFESVVDLIRRRAGARFDAVQLRANELNQQLDEDRFVEIDP